MARASPQVAHKSAMAATTSPGPATVTALLRTHHGCTVCAPSADGRSNNHQPSSRIAQVGQLAASADDQASEQNSQRGGLRAVSRLPRPCLTCSRESELSKTSQKVDKQRLPCLQEWGTCRVEGQERCGGRIPAPPPRRPHTHFGDDQGVGVRRRQW